MREKSVIFLSKNMVILHNLPKNHPDLLGIICKPIRFETKLACGTSPDSGRPCVICCPAIPPARSASRSAAHRPAAERWRAAYCSRRMSHPAGALDSIQIAGSEFRRLQGFGSAKTLDAPDGAARSRSHAACARRRPVKSLSAGPPPPSPPRQRPRRRRCRRTGCR